MFRLRCKYFDISVPGRPAGIKAVPAAPDAILVSWRPPVHANGVVTKYTIYIQDNDSHHTGQYTV